MTPRALAAITFTLGWETVFEPGHYGDDAHVVTERDPADPGGTTRYGIDQRSHPNIDIASLTLAQAQQTYFGGEWTQCQCEDLPAGIGEFVFDSAVNVGAHEAVKLLQEACGASVDGFLGPQTLAAVANAGAGFLGEIAAMYAERKAYYAAIVQNRPKMSRFVAGWDNRIAALQSFALALASPGSQS